MLSEPECLPAQIVEYPHPALRHVSKPLVRVDGEMRRTVERMFELMYEAEGVGLAANQVALPYRLFVANADRSHDRSNEMVFVNPVLRRHPDAEMEDAEEGCLSLPGLYAMVKRPDKVIVEAYDLEGSSRRIEATGLLARVVQHETDHLDGVLFIDRISPTSRLALKEPLEEFELAYNGRRQRGEIDDEAILARLAELERLRT